MGQVYPPAEGTPMGHNSGYPNQFTAKENLYTQLQDILNKLGEGEHLWKLDGKTVLGYSNATYKHIHNPAKVHPDDCSLITVESDSSANTFGDFVELFAAGEIPVAFDIHWANIQDISSNGTYIVEFHQVSNDDLQESEKFLGSFSVSRQSNFTRSFSKYTQVSVIRPNARVAVRVKDSEGSGEISFNVEWHDYE